jgi:hypothetical protein
MPQIIALQCHKINLDVAILLQCEMYCDISTTSIHSPVKADYPKTQTTSSSMLHHAPQVLRKKGLGKLVNIDGGR